MLSGLWELLRLHEPIWTAILADALFASWLTGAADLAEKAAEQTKQTKNRLPTVPPIQPPSMRFQPTREPALRFPQIEHAAKVLAGKKLIIKGEFDRMADKSHAVAFTVAKVQSLDGLDKIRKALVENLKKGGTLEEFQKKANDALGKSALSKSHLETVYRTNLMQGYGTGQKWAVQQPLLKTEFPYLGYSATHDGRTRPEHLAMETHGIGGTSIYRVDDPVIQTFWPGLWDWNCRCVGTFLTLRQAAKRGIEEARMWLKTGKPPEQPAFVVWPEFSPPPGFPVF